VRELFGLQQDAPVEDSPSGDLAEVHDLPARAPDGGVPFRARGRRER
jgi:hypothetical protein